MLTLKAKTNSGIVVLLNSLTESKQRVRLVYGDIDTGKDWLQEYDVVGTIGKSTGTNQIPLLLSNSRSTGGGTILECCILKIVDVKSKKVLYQHDKYIAPKFDIVPSIVGYSVAVDGNVQANFKTIKQAQNYIDFMLCKRMSK